MFSMPIKPLVMVKPLKRTCMGKVRYPASLCLWCNFIILLNSCYTHQLSKHTHFTLNFEEDSLLPTNSPVKLLSAQRSLSPILLGQILMVFAVGLSLVGPINPIKSFKGQRFYIFSTIFTLQLRSHFLTCFITLLCFSYRGNKSARITRTQLWRPKDSGGLALD